MSNSLLTINMITREAVRLWKNSNAFIQNINMQYDDSFARTGAKIGTSLRIRLPNDYTVRTGPALQAQDTAEVNTTLVLATQKGVDVSFNSVDMTMSLDDYSERILAPMVNNLAGAVAADIMSGVEGGISNYVANVDGGGNLLSPTSGTFLDAGALLDNNSAQVTDRKAVLDPRTMARTVQSLTGLFNPQTDIARQYKSARVYDALNYLWFQDQTVIKHTGGSFSAGTVNGANQTGTLLTTNAITGTLNAGDIITIGSGATAVNAVNMITKSTTGELRQFVVTANVASGATSIPIFPAIIGAIGGNPVQYQTVTASPANGAVIALVNPASTVYRKNFVYAPDAITMATADLYMPDGVAEAAREQFDGISMRMIRQYLIATDQEPCRLDVLYGYLFVRPQWSCIVADPI
jgi:hypothetical protein